MAIVRDFPFWTLLIAAGVVMLVIGIKVLLDLYLNPTATPVVEPDVSVSLRGTCGETIAVSLKVKDGIVTSASYFTDGCGPIAACGGVATRLAKGKPIEALPEVVYAEAIEEALGGLPEDKHHCAQLAAEAVLEAVHRYFLEGRKRAT